MVTKPAGEDADRFTSVEELDLVGGSECLDFVNTGSRRAVGPFRDRLSGYGDLVTWAERVGVLDVAAAAELRRSAERDPAAAAAVLERARALREAIYGAFRGGSAGVSPEAADLAVIAREAARAAGFRRLVATDACRCDYEWVDDSGELDRPLWPVAESAAELATSEDIRRVKECATDNCNWLFLDASKNRSRRWCDMKDCGNRAKARRFRQRTKSG